MTVLKLQRWLSLCDEVGCLGGAQHFHAVMNRWQSWGRHYHTRAHLEACLRAFDAVRSLAKHAGEVEMALWFHDAIYRTWRSDNEQRSADWAARVLRGGGCPEAVIARIESAILATLHGDEPVQGDAALVVDVDLSILGQSAVVYEQFERDVRREYWWVPRKRYVAARVGVLQGFLDRPRIYHFEPFVKRYEVRARENLAGAIGVLRG
jgi:predicted metal-dependent HD superfamily phosphohydrolase